MMRDASSMTQKGKVANKVSLNEIHKVQTAKELVSVL